MKKGKREGVTGNHNPDRPSVTIYGVGTDGRIPIVRSVKQLKIYHGIGVRDQ